MKLAIPDFPTLFMKPSTALADPWPAPTILPRITQEDNTGDYESEMVIVIGRDAKDVSEEDALDCVLGYTASNDVSSRTSQTNQSQWCFSKGFDTACPIGELAPLWTDFWQLRKVFANDGRHRPCPCIRSPFPRRQPIQDPWVEKRKRHAELSINVRIISSTPALPSFQLPT